jgi:TIR domain-containing protein/ClpA/ClpB-like protein
MLSRNLEQTLHRALAHANERHHKYATLEHLLLALTEDQDAVAVLRACGVDLDRLRREVLNYVDHELASLVEADSDDAKPTASFQRALQRAAIQVQSSGREEVSGGNVLVAMFAERESHAVYYLQEQEMTRFDAVNYIAHGIAKAPGRSQPPSIQGAIGQVAQELRSPTEASGVIQKAPAEQVKQPAKPIRKVFISYSHRDLRWISRLEIHLKPIVDAGLISHWHDRLIIPGSRWRDEIKLAIESAKIAVLMVSADFLASEFISRNEVPPLLKAAEETGCHILPIIVSPCRFTRTPALAEFQAVNSASRPLSGMNAHEREALFLRVADTIETILQSNPS